MKEEALLSLGLNTKQVQVYLSNLRLGSVPVQKIAAEAKMNRTSTYDILAALEKQGFVGHTITGGVRRYQAISPKNILGLLREKRDLVRNALPELESIEKSVVKKPFVEVYVGKNGIKTIFEDVLNNGKEMRAYSSLKAVLKLFKYYFPHFVEERKRRGIKIRLLIDKKPLADDAPYKIIKTTRTLMWMYSDTIAMISLEEKEPIGILIKEKNFYYMQKTVFDLLWDNLPEPT